MKYKKNYRISIKKREEFIMSGFLNGPAIRKTILNQGKTATESTAYFWGNITRAIQDTTQGSSTIYSGHRIGVSTFKASKNFVKKDVMCRSLCCISIGCEALSGVLVWCPIPSKVVTISTLKATSLGCQKFQDFCVADPSSSPLC